MTVPQFTQRSSSWRTTTPIVGPLGKWIAGIVAGLAVVVVAGLAGAIVIAPIPAGENR